MYALPGVAEVRSISKTGLSIITVVFEEGTDIYFARQLVFERLQDARERIPEGMGIPETGPNTSGLGQVFQYILRADDKTRFNIQPLRSLNDWVVKQRLMPVEGVTDVLSFGGEVRQYQVRIDPKRLLAYGLSVPDLAAAVKANNHNAGGWYLDRGAEQLVVRGVGWVRPGEDGLWDIGDIPLKNVDGVPVRVRDVAEVAFGAEIRQGAVTMTVRHTDGSPRQLGEVIAGIVLKRMGANTKATIEGIKKRLPAIQQALPDGVVIEPFYDQAELVEKAVATVTQALGQAFVLIVVVLALFLLNLRATFLVLISIPLSVGLALMVMAWQGTSANLMSLGGLAIAIVLAMLASVLVALTVVPALASYAFRRAIRARTSPLLRPLEWAYRWLLRGALRVRWLVVMVSVALLALTVAVIPRLGTEFVPELEEGTLNVRVTLAPSASLNTSLSVADKLKRILMTFPEVTYASSRVGRAELGGDPEPVSNIEIYVGLKPHAEWTTAPDRIRLQEAMERAMETHPGLLFSFSQPIATRVDELLSGVKAQLAIKLFGPDLEVLAEKGKAIENLAKTVQGARDVAMEQIAGESQLVVRPDRERLARFGIPISQVMALVADAIGGLEAGQVIQGNERYDIQVRLAPHIRDSAEAIGNLVLASADGAWVRLRDLARVGIESGSPQVRRDDVQRRVVIQANVEDRDLDGMVTELERRISAEIDLPPGYSVVVGGLASSTFLTLFVLRVTYGFFSRRVDMAADVTHIEG